MALGNPVSHASLFWITVSFLYMNALLRHFKLSAVFFIVNNFNTDALLVHGSIVSGFNGSQYPIVCILMHAWFGW